jgi:hypothetical protein
VITNTGGRRGGDPERPREAAVQVAVAPRSSTHIGPIAD